jgi:peptidoglycan/xylan/chitin deacetylase (PgdA/CDA1 family)
MADCGVRGTFFVPGWLAESFPDLISDIAAAGHEVASHGYGHDMSSATASLHGGSARTSSAR